VFLQVNKLGILEKDVQEIVKVTLSRLVVSIKKKKNQKNNFVIFFSPVLG